MNKIIFYLYDIFIRQPVLGAKELYNNLKEYFRKPSNLVFLLLFTQFILILVGAIASKMGKVIPWQFYIIYSGFLLLILIWKNLIGGDVHDRWRRHLNEKTFKLEQKKFK